MSISEKDAVLRERKAFVAGVRCYETARVFGNRRLDLATFDQEAKERYPLPKVTRPRVWKEPVCGMGWKVENGELWYTLSLEPQWCDWKRLDPDSTIHEVTPGRIHAWADLLANPTEEVEE